MLCLWRAASSRSDRAAWACIGAGLLFQAFGDRYYKSFLAGAAHVSQPSVADLGYLAFYPLAGAAVVLLLRARLRTLSRALVLDATVGALAVLAVVAALVFPDVLTTSGGDLPAVVTNLAYPICDLVLLGILIGGAQMLPGWGGRGLILIAVARRLRGCIRPEDTVARLGGDEFSVVISSADTDDAATCCLLYTSPSPRDRS